MAENDKNTKSKISPDVTDAVENAADTFSPKKKRRAVIAVIVVLVIAILAFVTAALVKELVITTYIVDGVSMYPTLDGGNGAFDDNVNDNGEKLILNKVAKIKRGDIVVFMRPDDWPISSNALVKRVIATEGDSLQIKDNKVYVNGELLTEDYINEPMLTEDLDVTISAGHLFCMGDNRNRSGDCRVYGEISEDRVIGKCIYVKGLDGKLRKP